jgi:Sulfite exporter TauE/SafE
MLTATVSAPCRPGRGLRLYRAGLGTATARAPGTVAVPSSVNGCGPEVLSLTAESFVLLIAIGFSAQLVDGALGMAFGLNSTTALLSLGIPPAQASAAVHTAEVATTAASGLSHLPYRNIHLRLLLTLVSAGVFGGVLGDTCFRTSTAGRYVPLFQPTSS